MLPYKVSQKIIVSGEYTEVYNYERPFWVGFPAYRRSRPRLKGLKLKQDKKPITGKMRMDNIKRSQKKLRRLINCNPQLNKFFTLTFAENLTDIKIANWCFKKFIQRCARLFPDFQYIAVPEFQERGAVHFHLLCNLPYIDGQEGLEALRKLWSHGWIDLKQIELINNVGAYLSHYMGKGADCEKLFKQKKFFFSRSLQRPIEYRRPEDVKCFYNDEQFFERLKNCLWKTTIDTQHFGMLSYSQYHTNILPDTYLL